jgi:hypothetical protein
MKLGICELHENSSGKAIFFSVDVNEIAFMHVP